MSDQTDGGLGEVHAYLDKRFREALAKATTCPVCKEPWMLADDPTGPGVWCRVCGYRRPTVGDPDDTATDPRRSPQ